MIYDRKSRTMSFIGCAGEIHFCYSCKKRIEEAWLGYVKIEDEKPYLFCSDDCREGVSSDEKRKI